MLDVTSRFSRNDPFVKGKVKVTDLHQKSGLLISNMLTVACVSCILTLFLTNGYRHTIMSVKLQGKPLLDIKHSLSWLAVEMNDAVCKDVVSIQFYTF